MSSLWTSTPRRPRRAGYSERTANEQGSQLLAKLSVREAIAEAELARSERTQIRADAVLRELARLGFSDLRNFVAWGPDGVRLRPSTELPEDLARCVSEVSQTVSEGGGSIKFKLHSKVEALDKLGRHLGLFKDVHEHTFPQGLPVSPEDAEAGRRLVEEHRRRRLARAHDDGSNGDGTRGSTG